MVVTIIRKALTSRTRHLHRGGRTTRLRRPPHARSSHAHKASTASSPTFRTMRNAPRVGLDGVVVSIIGSSCKEKFLAPSLVLPGKSVIEYHGNSGLRISPRHFAWIQGQSCTQAAVPAASQIHQTLTICRRVSRQTDALTVTETLWQRAISGLLHHKKSKIDGPIETSARRGACYLQPRQIVSLPFSLLSSPGSADCCSETRSIS